MLATPHGPLSRSVDILWYLARSESHPPTLCGYRYINQVRLQHRKLPHHVPPPPRRLAGGRPSHALCSFVHADAAVVGVLPWPHEDHCGTGHPL